MKNPFAASPRSLFIQLRAGSALSRTACLGLAVSLLPSQPALALPTGGQVEAGDVSIQQPQGAHLDINQNSGRAVVNWQSFDILNGESVRVNQPSVSAILLNRIRSGNATQILGQLSANGQIVVINPSGVVFGAGSRVDVGGLVASTADIRTADFMAGKMDFSLPGKPDASIVNKGSITAAQGGLVALVAPGVRNDGVIQAELGTVTLGSAQTFSVDFYGDSLYGFALGEKATVTPLDENGNPMENAVDNRGLISAKGGKVLLTAAMARDVVNNVINTDGIVEATSAHVGKNGEIVLDGGSEGNVRVAGKLDASGKESGQTGGKIQITGKDNIRLASGADLDASGANGGGSVKVGGDYQGQGSLAHANEVYADEDSVINVSAIESGNGGLAVLWSDAATEFRGAVYGTGGVNGGNGGLAEVSSKGELHFEGIADLHAFDGENGLLLLDPTNSTIYGGPTLGVVNRFVNAGSLVAVLNGGTNVLETATNNVNVLASMNWTGSGSLTLDAGNNVNIGADLISSFAGGSGSQGAITITAGNDILAGSVLGGDVTVSTNRGDLNLTAGNDITIGSTLAGNTLFASTAGAIGFGATNDINVGGGLLGTNAQILATGGDITLTAGDDVQVGGVLAGKGKIEATNGNVTVNSNDFILAKALIAGDSFVRAANNAIFNATGNVALIGGGAITASNGMLDVNNDGFFFSDTAGVLNNDSTAAPGSIRVRQNPLGTIQNPIDAIGTIGLGGAEVELGAGVWTEQVVINKGNLALNGQGAASTTIQAPAVLATQFFTPSPQKPVVYINAADDVTVSNLTIDGLGLGNVNTGILGIGFDDAGGLVDGVTITNVTDVPLGGTQHGTGVYALAESGTARSVTVQNSTVNNFQKNGLTFNGEDLTATAQGNTIVGSGATAVIAQNGIQFGFGARGTIIGNTISGIGFTLSPGVAAGILLDASGSGVTVSGNTITGTGVDSGVLAFDTADVDIQGNTVTGSAYGIGLYGASADSVIADNIVNDAVLFGIDSQDNAGVTIRGNTVDGIGAGTGINLLNGSSAALTGNDVGGFADGIVAVSAPGLTVGDGTPAGRNTVHDNANIGIWIDGSDGAVVDTNVVTDNGVGIRVNPSNGALVSGNSVSGTVSDGLQVINSNSVQVLGNTLTQIGRDAIHAENSNNLEVGGNTIIGDVGGAGAARDGISVSGGEMANVHGNMLLADLGTAALGYGILVTDNRSASVTDNQILATNFGLGAGMDGIRVLNSGGTMAADAGVVVTGNTVSGDATSLGAAGNGITVNNGSAGAGGAAPTVSGNTILRVTGIGIQVVDAVDALINGNMVTTTGGDGINANQAAFVNNNTVDDADGNGIALSGSTGITVDGNTVTNSGANGITGNNLASFTITGNSASDSIGAGLLLTNSGPGTVGGGTVGDALQNTFGNNAVGVDAENATQVTVRGNAFSDNGIGVRFANSDQITVDANSFTGNGTGLEAFGATGLSVGGNSFLSNTLGARLTNTGGASVTGNNFLANAVGGLILTGSNAGVFAGNSFISTGIAATLEGSSNATFTGDIFTGNTLGIDLNNSGNARIQEVIINLPGGGTGIQIRNDSPDTIVRDLTANGGNIGILLDGANASMQFEGDNSRFNGQNFYFALQNGAMSGDVLVATQQFFGGVRAANFTAAQLNAAEARTVDISESATLGDVFYRDIPILGSALDEFQKGQGLYNLDIFSYAGRTIANNAQITPPTFQVVDVNLSLLGAGNPGGNFGALSPAAGGDPSALGSLAPAAGGLGELSPAAGGDSPNCGNSFLGAGFAPGFQADSCTVQAQ